MGKLSPRSVREIRRYTTATIQRLLQFRLTHNLTKYQLEKVRANWRDAELELHDEYPITEAGVIAVLSNGDAGVEGLLRRDEFLITDEPVSPEEIISLLGSFPLDAAAGAYVFAMLEEYGDTLVKMLNPKFEKTRTSWHRDVYAGTKIGGPAKRKKLEIAFGKPFGLEKYAIAADVVLSLMLLKKERNAFAHSGRTDMSFDEFFERALRVICYIYLMVLPSTDEILIVAPKDDLTGRFRDAAELRKAWEEEKRRDHVTS